jgi:hypothetical protein
MRYLVLMCVILAGPAAADEVSPWFGSTDQTPFQMRSDGTAMAAGDQQETLDHAELRGQADCAITGCSLAEGSANVLGAGLVSP